MALSGRIEGDMGFLTSHDLGILTKNKVDKKEQVDPIVLASQEVSGKLDRLADSLAKNEDPSVVGFSYSFENEGTEFNLYLMTAKFTGVNRSIEWKESDEAPAQKLIFQYEVPDYYELLEPSQFSIKDKLMHSTAQGPTPIARKLELPVLNHISKALDSQLKSPQANSAPQAA